MGHTVLRVVGADRESFLQGMVSNDVAGLAVGQACLATAMTPKGALVGVLRVYKGPEALLLDVLDGRGPAVKAHLERSLISEDAEVHEAGDVAVLSLVGSGVDAFVAAHGLLGEGRCLARLEGSLGAGVDLLVPAAALGELTASLEPVPPLEDAEAERLRVERGVPRFGVDVGESTIPLEGNLGRAVHLQKGCYVGQEVIARMTYRGHVNKRLMGLRLESLPAPATPATPGGELRAAGQKVGWLTSVVWSPSRRAPIALGYVRRDFAEAGKVLELAAGGTATVCALPFEGDAPQPAPSSEAVGPA